MAGFVQWKHDSNGEGKTDFLTLKSGSTYKIRPLLEAYNFNKYFHKIDGKMRTAVVDDEVVSQLAAKYPSELNKPANRYAMYVIDRNDENKIKIMEFPISVYKAFCNSFDATKRKPGSRQDGSDWLIKKTGTGLNTSYETTFVDYTPLTEDEYEKFKKVLGGDLQRIAAIFPFSTLEEAEKKLFGPEEENDSDVSPKASAKKTVVAKPNTASASVSADTADAADDFDPDW
jgi:hypothetical protein